MVKRSKGKGDRNYLYTGCNKPCLFALQEALDTEYEQGDIK